MKKSIIAICLVVLTGWMVQSQTANNTKASAVRGKKVYTTYCLACHQADGGGVPRMNPPLTNTIYVNGDKTRLINIVLKGLNDPIEIDGEEFRNQMASQGFLTDVQVADVLTFVRSNFGNKSSAVTPVEVKKVRAAIK